MGHFSHSCSTRPITARTRAWRTFASGSAYSILRPFVSSAHRADRIATADTCLAYTYDDYRNDDLLLLFMLKTAQNQLQIVRDVRLIQPQVEIHTLIRIPVRALAILVR
jgi:hypothetical protein